MANKIPIVIADFETQLSAAIAAGATSFVLASNTDDDGVTLPAGKYCFTVNNGSANKQYLIGQVNGVNVTAVVSVDRQGTETSGSQFAARAGSPVMISNFAALQRVADILRGQISLDGANPIEYDAEPTLADREQLATVGYVLDNVTGGTVTFNKQTIAGTAGETFSAGDFVYFNATDREWYALDASALASSANPKIGVALGDGSDGVAITGGIQVAGSYTTTGLTAGAVYFATDTAGAIGTSAGTFARRVGVALSTTVLYIDSSDERKSPRVSTETSSATPTINTDLVDVHQLTAQAVDITSMSSNLSGNPALWEIKVIEITATAGGDIDITWGSSFSDGDVYNLPATVTASTTLKVFLNYNGSTWSVIGFA